MKCYNSFMLKKHFELDSRAVSALNRRAESVQRAAAAVLGNNTVVPLVVFDENIQVPPSHQQIEGATESTPFGVAMTPQCIKMHPREILAVTDETVRRNPNIPEDRLLSRIDAQLWNFLVRTTIESPSQGREDLEAIISQTFSLAFRDWASRKYGVTIPKKSP